LRNGLPAHTRTVSMPSPPGLNPDTLTSEQVAALKPDQVQEVLKYAEWKRWADEAPYFRALHDLLPEPFFQTQGFLLFLVAIGALYWIRPGLGARLFPTVAKRQWNTYRVWLLVLASFHFYAAWNASLAFLVTASATLDYLLARLMGRTGDRRVRFALMMT